MRKFKMNTLYIGISAFLVISNAFAKNSQENEIIVIPEAKNDISVPLSEIPITSYSSNRLKNKIEQLINVAASSVSLTAFQGIGQGLGSYTVSAPASQVSGAVGMNQYVQWVDPDFAVFDKASGALAPGFPKPGNAIWTGFGGPCETQNIGAPNVKYDQLAHRWILTRQAFVNRETGPFFQCVAVSTSEDATGSYYRYSFPMDSLSNYGKLALWPDAYYMGMQMFGPQSNGPRVCAFDRDKMLMGSAATAQCKQLMSTVPALFPSDLGGTELPPTGMPDNFFGIYPPHQLVDYKFHVDWANPAASFVDSGIKINVLSYILPCASTQGQQCAVQPDTSQRLDLIATAFASRIAYRHFSSYGTFVLTHTIQGGAPKLSPALRWYELRVANAPFANPTIYQQATFEPNSMARFTGSIAIDKSENIAIGYTVSSTAVHPSPEMAYRNSTMPLNTLIKQPLYTGTGSQLSSDWTNYSAMAIDPVDSCTFWYTSQYLQTSGTFNWSTAIVHFKLAGC